MIYGQFYSELGKLVFAIMHTEGLLKDEEKINLLPSLHRMLIPLEKHKDRFGENVVSYVVAEADFLEEQSADPYSSFESFLDFTEQHYTGIDRVMLEVMEWLYSRIHLQSDPNLVRYNKLLRRMKAVLDKIKGEMKIFRPARITSRRGLLTHRTMPLKNVKKKKVKTI
jgi:hypothetical protein